MAPARIIHSPEEIARIRRAALITASVRDDLAALARPGMTTFELDRLAGELIARTGGTSAFKNYYGFPGNLCISLNDEVIHGIGRVDVVIKEQDIVFHRHMVGMVMSIDTQNDCSCCDCIDLLKKLSHSVHIR